MNSLSNVRRLLVCLFTLNLFTENVNSTDDTIQVYQPIIDQVIKIEQKEVMKKLAAADGPLYNFVVNICRTIVKKFKSKNIPSYLKLLGRTLKNLAFVPFKEFFKYFAKKLDRMSRRKSLKREIVRFLTFLNSGKPKTIEFFQTINPFFNGSDDFRMDDYIFYLSGYGQSKRVAIKKKSRIIFRLIFKKVQGLKVFADQHKIVVKLMGAIMEHRKAQRNETDLTDITQYISVTKEKLSSESSDSEDSS